MYVDSLNRVGPRYSSIVYRVSGMELNLDNGWVQSPNQGMVQNLDQHRLTIFLNDAIFMAFKTD